MLLVDLPKYYHINRATITITKNIVVNISTVRCFGSVLPPLALYTFFRQNRRTTILLYNSTTVSTSLYSIYMSRDAHWKILPPQLLFFFFFHCLHLVPYSTLQNGFGGLCDRLDSDGPTVQVFVSNIS